MKINTIGQLVKTNPIQTQFPGRQNEQKIAYRKIQLHPKKLRLDFSNNNIRMTGNKNKDF